MAGETLYLVLIEDKVRNSTRLFLRNYRSKKKHVEYILRVDGRLGGSVR